jgi:hypothetical protein
MLGAGRPEHFQPGMCQRRDHAASVLFLFGLVSVRFFLELL